MARRGRLTVSCAIASQEAYIIRVASVATQPGAGKTTFRIPLGAHELGRLADRQGAQARRRASARAACTTALRERLVGQRPSGRAGVRSGGRRGTRGCA
jgi:hypothetical protein